MRKRSRSTGDGSVCVMQTSRYYTEPSPVTLTLILCGRGNYKSDISVKRLQKPLFAVVMFVVCIAVLCVVLPKDDEKYVRDQMNVAVDALASGNVGAWQATIHPKYGSHLMNLQEYLADLEQDGIIIAPDCYVDGRINVAEIPVDDGHIIRIERKLRSGEKTYIIKAEYQFGEEAEGFVLFEIMPFRKGPAPY